MDLYLLILLKRKSFDKSITFKVNAFGPDMLVIKSEYCNSCQVFLITNWQKKSPLK